MIKIVSRFLKIRVTTRNLHKIQIRANMYKIDMVRKVTPHLNIYVSLFPLKDLCSNIDPLMWKCPQKKISYDFACTASILKMFILEKDSLWLISNKKESQGEQFIIFYNVMGVE